MHTDFKFNQGIVNNTVKYSLAELLDLEKPMQVSLS